MRATISADPHARNAGDGALQIGTSLYFNAPDTDFRNLMTSSMRESVRDYVTLTLPATLPAFVAPVKPDGDPLATNSEYVRAALH
jgi:hypothetical protein